MKAIFMGKDKREALKGLSYLVQRGVDVVAVVAEDPSESKAFSSLAETARHYEIPVISEEDLYRKMNDNDSGLSSIDFVVSFLFWNKIKKELLDHPRLGCINFHPAPLPGYRGMGGYNIAIYEGLSTWGVSAHFMDESFDTGDIIKVKEFPIDPKKETAFSLHKKSMEHLLELFQETMDTLLDKGELPRIPQKGKSRYISKEDYENLKEILPTNSEDEVNRKIRAFWFPPYEGAFVNFKGKNFTLVNKSLLEEIQNYYVR